MIKNRKDALGLKEKCSICNGKIELRYKPMKEWNIEGTICGACYSKQVHTYYPGEHIRVNLDLN